MTRQVVIVGAVLSVLLCAMLVLIARDILNGGFDTRSSEAINNIARFGMATMKPTPDGSVRVFVAQNGQAKQFGDQQLAAILPLLPQIEGLDALDLHDSSVSDASIAGVQGLTALKALDVSNTNMTLNGLLRLKGLPKLRSIVVGPGQLTEEQLATLNAAFPTASVSIRPPG